jgi:hypothetical protein
MKKYMNISPSAIFYLLNDNLNVSTIGTYTHLMVLVTYILVLLDCITYNLWY